MKFLFVIFLLPLHLFAQDITGVWTGTLYNDTTKQFIKYELAISEYNGKLSGYSHTIFVIDSVENIGVKSIKIKKSGEEFLLEDDKLISNNYIEAPAKGVKTYSDLVLLQNDTAMILKGLWKTNRTRHYNGLTGTIFLQKRKKVRETLIIPKLDTLGITRSLSFMTAQDYPNDLAAVNKQGINSERHTNQAAIEKEVASNTPKQANPEIPKVNQQKADQQKADQQKADQQRADQQKADQQKADQQKADQQRADQQKADQQKADQQKADQQKADQQNKADQQIAKEALTKENKAKEKTAIKDVQLPLADLNAQKDQATKDIAAITTSTKPNNPPVNEQNKAGKEIPNVILKNDSSGIKTVKQPISKPADSSGNIKAVKQPVSKPAAEIAKREIETIRSVNIKSDSLLLSLFDNGEIDGDTVSVLLNGKVIMPNQGLTSRAINKTIYLTPEMGDSLVLIMYAENLGSIAPNTGLLVIHDGEDVYEIRFSGDLKKNSSIILKRKRKQ